MTGAEHYERGETILAEAGSLEDEVRPEAVVSLLRFAQVHATLALAAAVSALSPDATRKDPS